MVRRSGGLKKHRILLFVVGVSEFDPVVLTESGTVDQNYKSRGNFANNYSGEDGLWSRGVWVGGLRTSVFVGISVRTVPVLSMIDTAFSSVTDKWQ
jgi:hypothetical protein